MKPLQVGQSYDQLADHWASDRFDRTNGVPQHERALALCTVREHALDIGCGSSGRLISLLLSRGFSVDAVDVSERMLELSREKQPDANYHLADFCLWQAPGQYDFISAWDSVWHVPLDAHEAMLSKVFGLLNPRGVCIFTMGGLDEPGEVTNHAMGPEMYHSTLGIPQTLKVIESSGCSLRHLEFDQYPEPHVYVIAQKR